ncbi:cobalt ECF transporter T component CbiQ [Bacillus sp. FJAT-42315]|uniref:cobalt ECF transporter T component CbiQ n=1 Tax=Bacillus sp. FJAT-42315 TaxID=2014077 RepID=UPI000C24F388|nr:cobalt ECF transporter T component CbiQ [Bacillus sp. FJAT-42315]
MIIDYYANHSRLSHLHPGEKAAFAFSHLLLVLFTKEIVLSVYVFVLMGVVSVSYAKIPFRTYRKLLLLPLIFLLFSLFPLLLSFVREGTEVDALLQTTSIAGWFMYVSYSSLQQAVLLCVSAYAAVSCMYFFILTTPFHGIATLLRLLRLPEVFVELTAVTYRFIFVFIEKAAETYNAQRSRAGYSGLRSTFSSISMLVANLFVQTMREAKQVQMAIDARGGSEVEVGQMISYPTRRDLWGAITVCFLISCVVVYVF